MRDKAAALEADAMECLELLEKEREQIGHTAAAECYWGGYVDALCKVQGKMTRANIDWASDGVVRMFSKRAVDDMIRDQLENCQACGLHADRTKVVPGHGPLWTPLMIVGRDPGKDEDEAGLPFVGRAGDTFFNPSSGILPSTIGYKRENVRISNCVHCHTPGNRGPSPEETFSCSRYLRWEVLNVQPKVVLALGAAAASWFKGEDVAIGAVRGKPFQWEGITVVTTYHPSYLLRSQSTDAAGKVKADLQVVLKELQR